MLIFLNTYFATFLKKILSAHYVSQNDPLHLFCHSRQLVCGAVGMENRGFVLLPLDFQKLIVLARFPNSMVLPKQPNGECNNLSSRDAQQYDVVPIYSTIYYIVQYNIIYCKVKKCITLIY